MTKSSLLIGGVELICELDNDLKSDRSENEDKGKNLSEDINLSSNYILRESREKGILYPVVFMVGMAIIILEIGLTRVFSIALWHHFAFLSIAIALFGMGSSGVFLTVYPGVIKRNFYKTLFNFIWLLSLTNIIAFFIFTRLKLDVRNLGNPANLFKFFLFYFFLSLPFFFGGCVMSAIISRKSKIVQKLYFWDLFGAGLGCLVVVLLIKYFGGQGIVIISSILSAVAAISVLRAFPAEERKRRSIGIILYALGLLIILPAARSIFPIPLPPDKALNHYIKKAGAKVIFSRWNSFSLVDAFAPVPRYTWGLSPEFKSEMPPQIGITIDGDGFTSIIKHDGPIEEVEFPRFTLGSMVHMLNKGGDTLIIGAGGGIDVFCSRSFGTKNIEAVEINPDIAYLATQKYKDYSGHLFERPGINMIVAEGRNYIKRKDKKYNLIYLPLVDSWAATYSGAYSLSENYLYTVEAFQDYYDRVGDDGFISISRWEYIPERPYQSLRLCSLAMAAANSDLRNSVVVISQGKLANFIWKKGEFTAGEIEQVKSFCFANRFKILYIPGMRYNNAGQFEINDILDWTGLIKSLKAHKTADLKRIWEHLNNESREAITAWKPGESFDERSKMSVIASLNEILDNNLFYDPQAFPPGKLDREGIRLLRIGSGNLKSSDMRRFNRLVIESVFMVEIARSRNNFSLILDRNTSKDFQEKYPLDISPVTDDRPFFYLTDKWKNFFIYLDRSVKARAHFPIVFTIVLVVLSISILFCGIFIILPLKIKGIGDFSGRSSILFLIYFILLGLAFMFVEITLMTKMALFLGHPTYSLSVVLFSLLIFTGIGSYLSSLSKLGDGKTMILDVCVLFVIGFSYFFVMDKILAGALPLGHLTRAAIAVLLIAPIGICLGMPFPLGLKRLGEENSVMIPWAWGVNGCASVMGSVLALVFAQAFGFWNTLLLALGFYIIAAIIFSMIFFKRHEEKK